MIVNDLICVLPADPDSHFQLKKCRLCESDDNGYVQRHTGRWAVRCFGCGFESPEADTRHGAQVKWNGGRRR